MAEFELLSWLSANRALLAAVLILVSLASFAGSIIIGRRISKEREKDEVFGDPERTKGGWYWSVCGVAALLLVWFYYSWGSARAYFPQSANELCQVAKLHNALSPINAALPSGSRYFKSTTLVTRNREQLAVLQAGFPQGSFSDEEGREVSDLFIELNRLIASYSNPALQDEASSRELSELSAKISALSARLRDGSDGLSVSSDALEQPGWGLTHIEIPLLPETPLGVLFDEVATEAEGVAKSFLGVRNAPPAADAAIADIRARIADLQAGSAPVGASEAAVKARAAFIKSLDRIFKRLDDGTIFPAAALDGIVVAMNDLDQARDEAKGFVLRMVDSVLMPGGEIIKSRTQCTEQGPGRWLPKPTDVVAKFALLANPDLEAGGGFKGTELFWWKWLSIADVVGFLTPDWIADLVPGEYGRHASDGSFTPNFKDSVLAFAQGQVDLGRIPMFAGHIWDSLFRVLSALALGILLGVPLGIYMGVSRFFKSFFDPLIELYRPVPPLAWAPLILTIFGIQDDGKIFLLFMVAFAIMVISARTGASGTQLSKIRASHSLGASTGQILRNVILPNAMPEILTGIRIAIGVCWGTLVAAEMLAGTTGIGFIENVARTVSDYELIWVTILIMGLLGLMFDLMMRWVIAKSIPWRGKG